MFCYEFLKVQNSLKKNFYKQEKITSGGLKFKLFAQCYVETEIKLRRNKIIQKLRLRETLDSSLMLYVQENGSGEHIKITSYTPFCRVLILLSDNKMSAILFMKEPEISPVFKLNNFSQNIIRLRVSPQPAHIREIMTLLYLNDRMSLAERMPAVFIWPG